MCAAVAAINSFIFLQNLYPFIYDNKLTPNRTGNTDDTDADAFALSGWQVPGQPPREGYYPRATGPMGDVDADFLVTKMDWINDHAPGTTMFDALYRGHGGRPTIDWLAEEIRDGEDVEIFVEGPPGAHALTLTGIACDDGIVNCRITFSDPNDPTNRYNRNLRTGEEGRLEFDGIFGYPVTFFIDAAFSESPAVPEPCSLILLFTGTAVLLGRRVRPKT